MTILKLSFECGESSLIVSRFSVDEAISSLFTVSVWARSKQPDIDLEAIIGKRAGLSVQAGWLFVRNLGERVWEGVCSYIEQAQVEPAGVSTYYLRIVPSLWLLTQRRGHRIFQHLSIPDIADKLLAEWNVVPDWQIERGSYPKLEYRVQYGESDYDFLSRLLEEAGIAFAFPDQGGTGTKLTLSDKLHATEPSRDKPIPFVDSPNKNAQVEFVTHVRLGHEVRPGAHTIRDYDFRNPGFALFGEAPKAAAPEDQYEQYSYSPGAFLVETGKGGDTPVADAKGVARYDPKYGAGVAEQALLSNRTDKRSVAFATNTIDLWPGAVFSVDNHPHPELDPSKRLLVATFSIEGAPGEEWVLSGRAIFADPKVPFRPPQGTPKPKVYGLQSATVVGPQGQEIHTDEFGRVRVQFPWDREGKSDDDSSCWIRVSQGWAGTGFGMFTLPRVGQEVLVGFLEGDPDQPIVAGRVFNAQNPVPYKLPDNKTVSTWKSSSSPSSDGYNEIRYEDKAGQELVSIQAQRDMRKLVKRDEAERVSRHRHATVGGNEDLIVKGERRQQVGGKMSLTVQGDLQQKIDGDHALEAGSEIHLKAGQTLILEAGQRLTVKGPGGFIDIHEGGVDIVGTLVNINSGGSAGSGKGAHPTLPAEAEEQSPNDP